jgi:hypothetical protein
MFDLPALSNALDGMIADYEAQKAREMSTIAETSRAVVIERVSQTGQTASGGLFKPYTPAYEQFKRGASSAKLTKKKRTAVATATKPIGRFTGFRNFTLTGDMLSSIGIIEQRQEGDRYIVRVGARDDENRLKMIGNDNVTPGWWTMSVKEQENAAADSSVRMKEWAMKFLGR